MKKTVLVLILSCALFALCSCTPAGPYKVGGVGPAGGLVFYDCDADNRRGNKDGLISSECGWRYMELAPVEVEIGDQNEFIFGYFRESDSNPNIAPNTNPDDRGIGDGKANTETIVEKFGDQAYARSSGSEKTSLYAAKVASEWVYNGYDDWYLPSLYEIHDLVFFNDKIRNNNRLCIEIGVAYMTSSITAGNGVYSCSMSKGGWGYEYKSADFPMHIVCARCFLPEE